MREWRQRYQLQRIGLFGSTARNQATASSDRDVWVELDPLTPCATVHLKQALELLLQLGHLLLQRARLLLAFSEDPRVLDILLLELLDRFLLHREGLHPSSLQGCACGLRLVLRYL